MPGPKDPTKWWKIVVDVVKWAVAFQVAENVIGPGTTEIIQYVEDNYPEQEESVKMECAAMAARITGQVGDETLWPRYRRGDNAGEKIPGNYLVVNMHTGDSWVTSRYYSRKSVNAGFQRGRRSGSRRKLREIAQESEIHNN